MFAILTIKTGKNEEVSNTLCRWCFPIHPRSVSIFLPSTSRFLLLVFSNGPGSECPVILKEGPPSLPSIGRIEPWVLRVVFPFFRFPSFAQFLVTAPLAAGTTSPESSKTMDPDRYFQRELPLGKKLGTVDSRFLVKFD